MHRHYVAKHYDKHRSRGKSHDHMLVPRKCHNFIKSCIITRYTKANSRVLDMCCGSGGDIAKLKSAGCSQYIGVDISQGACERAQVRLENTQLSGDVIVSDAFGDEMLQIVTHLRPFDVVNCQFALHYSFDSVEHAMGAFKIVSSALKVGGVFLGTVADGDKLDVRRATLGKKFGDRYFKVAFEKQDSSEYGDAYAFTFNGAVDNLVEYATRECTFRKLAESVGLRVDMWENMSTLATELRYVNDDQWNRMGCTDIVDVTSLYSVFACTKIDR